MAALEPTRVTLACASPAASSAHESRADEMTTHDALLDRPTATIGNLSHQDSDQDSPDNTLILPSPSTGDDLIVPKQRGERPSSVIPPFWQHTRQASRLSVASSLGPIGIRLEDNTIEHGDVADGNDGGLRSPLWARHVEIDKYVRVEGDIKGVGGYTVWLVRVQKLDGGSEIVLRKRYSEFESLRDNLKAAFPHAGSSLPNLPPKSVLYKYRPSFLEKRRIGLKYFMNCVLLNPEFAGCTAVRDFIFD